MIYYAKWRVSISQMGHLKVYENNGMSIDDFNLGVFVLDLIGKRHVARKREILIGEVPDEPFCTNSG